MISDRSESKKVTPYFVEKIYRFLDNTICVKIRVVHTKTSKEPKRGAGLNA